MLYATCGAPRHETRHRVGDRGSALDRTIATNLTTASHFLVDGAKGTYRKPYSAFLTLAFCRLLCAQPSGELPHSQRDQEQRAEHQGVV